MILIFFNQNYQGIHVICEFIILSSLLIKKIYLFKKIVISDTPEISSVKFSIKSYTKLENENEIWSLWFEVGPTKFLLIPPKYIF